jgi:hypothetical protein
MISAIPANSNGSNRSPRNTALSMIALTGTSSVTREAFVAPAEAIRLKYKRILMGRGRNAEISPHLCCRGHQISPVADPAGGMVGDFRAG